MNHPHMALFRLFLKGGESLYQCIVSDQEFWGNYSQSTEGVSIQCLVSVEIL